MNDASSYVATTVCVCKGLTCGVTVRDLTADYLQSATALIVAPQAEKSPCKVSHQILITAVGFLTAAVVIHFSTT